MITILIKSILIKTILISCQKLFLKKEIKKSTNPIATELTSKIKFCKEADPDKNIKLLSNSLKSRVRSSQCQLQNLCFVTGQITVEFI